MGKITPIYVCLLFVGLFLMACGSESPATNSSFNPPYISSFSPSEGKAGKTSVNISAGNFQDSQEDLSIKFNGVPAAITTVTENGFVVAVPEKATSGKISLTYKNSIGYSARDFVVVAAPEPKIKSFEPTFGLSGTKVTLKGKNFGPTMEENSVYFNGIAAEVASVSKGKLVVTVPDGDVAGHITVWVDEVQGTSNLPFGME
nr:IPT/TIG domain-containing protein [Allomuricauda sp.]